MFSIAILSMVREPSLTLVVTLYLYALLPEMETFPVIEVSYVPTSVPEAVSPDTLRVRPSGNAVTGEPSSAYVTVYPETDCSFPLYVLLSTAPVTVIASSDFLHHCAVSTFADRLSMPMLSPAAIMLVPSLHPVK